MFEQMEANELARCEPHSGARSGKAADRKSRTSTKVVGRGVEDSLIASSFSLPSDFFAEKAPVALYNLENSSKIKSTALLDTGAIGYSFVYP